jgi:sugar lactone lactonase YvrE
MNRRLLVLSLSLVLASLTAANAANAAEQAVRELGQPDFFGFMPNRVDGRGLAQPWGVAVDTSRSPNGLWVLDASNNRVLGWRDVTTLHDGKEADIVIGQPDARSIGCNTGGVSAASLCFVQSFNGFAYSPGLAVDTEGNLYVADQYNVRILGYRRPFETDGVADLVIGQPGFDQIEGWSGVSASRLYRPHGLAVDAQGNFYLSDEIRVLEFDRPFATDAVADRVFGQSGLDTHDVEADPSAPDRMAYADGIAVDAQGRLYVADAWMDRVMVWKEPLARQGAADLVFSQGVRTCDYAGCNSKGIAIEPDGDVWVGSHEQGRIFGYRSPLDGLDGDIEPDRVIVAANSGQVYDPEAPRDGRPMFAAGGLAVDSSGALWLTDASRVLGFFDPWNGNGRADRLLGQVRRDQIEANLVDHDGLAGPDGIAIDTSVDPPRLYVVDASNHRVLGWADAAGFANGQPADLVIGQPDRWSSGCNTGGRSLASLCIGTRLINNFNGIDVDAQGTVWVSDPGNARVLGFRSPFTTDTVADRVLGGIGCVTGSRGMCIPGGLAVDKTGSLYVADIGNNRILWFNQPARHSAVADRVLGARNFRQTVCNDAATCFSQENGSHPGLDINGGSLAVDAKGRLLVGNGGAVYVFERPLLSGARSRKLIDLAGIEGFPYFPPQDLATDSADRIYLTSGYHVYRFSRNGAGPSLELGERCVYGYDTGLLEGFGPASLCIPTGLAVGPGDELFVSDADANRVVVFDNP